MKQRRRRSEAHTFEERIAAEIARLEEQRAAAPQGVAHDALTEKIRQLESSLRMAEFLMPSPPKT